MDVDTITIERSKARDLWRAYNTHRHYSTPVDDEIRRTYQKIAQGKVVIRALESIRRAGLDEKGLPKLAIVRADATECILTITREEGARFSTGYAGHRRWSADHWSRHHIDLPPGTFEGARPRGYWDAGRAIVPIIPAHLRPKRGLANYHILWEAEWEKIVPRDPMLLRRMGKGDLWLVTAAWDLTEVERAALAARIAVS